MLRFNGLFGCFHIKMLLEDDPDQLIQISLRHKFVADPSGRECVAQILDNRKHERAFPGNKGMDHNVVLHDIVNRFGARMIVFHKDLKIKDDTFIDTVIRSAAVQDTVGYKDNVAGFAHVRLIVEGQIHFPRNDPYQLIVSVPVKLHVIARTVRSLMIKGNRKIEGSLFSVFFIFNKFHTNT